MYTDEIIETLKEYQETNHQEITGTLDTAFHYAFTSKPGIKYHEAMLKIKTPESRTTNTIIIVAADYQLEHIQIAPDDASCVGNRLKIAGPIRVTHHKNKETGKRINTTAVYAMHTFRLAEESEPDENHGCLCGRLKDIKNPKKTNSGKLLTEFRCETDRNYSKKTDYIPCVTWGHGSKVLPSIEENDSVRLTGHLQNRNYKRKDGKTWTVYEYVADIDNIERASAE